MLLKEIRAIKSGRKERHQFGLLIGAVALAAGCLLAWRKGVHPELFAIAAICLIPVAIDKVFKTDMAIALLPFQKVWMGLAVVLGFIMSRIILGVFFFGAFTTVRLLNGFFGKALLDTAWDKKARDSYWIPRDAGEYSPEQSERQF